MLEAAVAQLRFVYSLTTGKPFSLRSLDRMLDALLQTMYEHGEMGTDALELIGSPPLDEATRQEFALRRFRSQAVRAARETDYYRRLFHEPSLDPAALRLEDLSQLPLTPKEALRHHPDDFVCRSARPCFRATTTGTTGRPTSVCFSDRELRAYVALHAQSLLVRGQILPEDIVQISSSARATLGNHCFIGACQRIGALTHLAGLIQPEQTLALLAERHRLPGKRGQVSALFTYPSYLGRILTCGLQCGYRPDDFGLERIFLGGELVTEGLKRRCQQLFGPVTFYEGFGMTEVWPVCGARCSQGHLHFEPTQGLVEVCDPDTRAPARSGAAGSLVITPFMPFRETTLLLRYDTQDMVCALDGPFQCELRHLPATSDLLGKRSLSARHETGWTFPRQVVEALESVEAVPLPARYAFYPVACGVGVRVRVSQNTAAVRETLGAHLEARGVPLRDLVLTEDSVGLERALPLRSDLCEASFGAGLRAEPLAVAAHPGPQP